MVRYAGCVTGTRPRARSGVIITRQRAGGRAGKDCQRQDIPARLCGDRDAAAGRTFFLHPVAALAVARAPRVNFLAASRDHIPRSSKIVVSHDSGRGWSKPFCERIRDDRRAGKQSGSKQIPGGCSASAERFQVDGSYYARPR